LSNDFDVVVIGGGHNGLVAAGLLARRGARVTMLERRSVVGGAAITEQPWGPDFNVTALSYVVSLMPPTIVNELQLERHGYKVFPQNGYFVPYRNGGYLQLPDDDPTRRRAPRADAPRSRSIPRTMPMRSNGGTRGWAVWPTYSDHCSPRFRRALAPGARAISSIKRAWVGSCAASTCAAPPTSRACSR
jgi:glycine/D-amino acid oxidase-like deaminating enzyme